MTFPSMASSLNEKLPCYSGAAACNLPAPVSPTPDDNSARNDRFDKFLVIKHGDNSKKMTKMDPFKIDKALKGIIGTNHGCKIQPLRNGLLLIEVGQKKVHDQLLSIKLLDDIPVTVTPHNALNFSKGTIVCDALDHYTNKDLKQKLIDHDVEEVYRVEKKENNKTVKTNLYILTFRRTEIPNEVKIGFLNLPVRLYIPNPRRCFRCHRFGHGINACTHDPVCAKCGKTNPGHEFGQCNEDMCCSNCKGPHAATSKQCPIWQLEKKTTERKLTCGLKYPEAKAQIIYENPDLARKIPHLQSRTKSKSYSSVASSPSVTEQMLQQQQQFFEQQKLQMDHMQKQIDILTNILKSQFFNPNISTSNIQVSERAVKRSRQDGSSSSEETIPSKQAPKSTSSGQGVTNMPAPPLPSDSNIRGAVGDSSLLPRGEVRSSASLSSKESEATPMDDSSVGDPSPPPRRARDSSLNRRPAGGG